MGRCKTIFEIITDTTVLAGLLSGAIGGMGLGGGGVLLVFLTVFKSTPQSMAQGINLLFFVPIGLTAILLYQKQRLIKWSKILPMWVGGIVGAPLGFWLVKIIEGHTLSKMFALFLILLGIITFFAPDRQEKRLHFPDL